MLHTTGWSGLINRFSLPCSVPNIATAVPALAIRWAVLLVVVLPPFIAAVRVIWADGSWHYIALYLAVGCLLTALVAALVPKTQDE
ncbi:Major facilitator superfamily (MFS) profile domain-containing protein [Acinetobacter pseudolwoffii]|uniref:Uncharacterized protein n=1 Tax=Acinetobacter pseudolwoffii TaxID=2053287 RepID=N9KWR0_9GAMM|nr:hypothetical protein F906_00398 [Acinetobacter pseudolwoffii]